MLQGILIKLETFTSLISNIQKTSHDTKFKHKSQKMCNVFTLGTVFTSIEIALCVLLLNACAFVDHLRTYGIIITITITILMVDFICCVLELIGLKKKHFGLTIFSVVFRSIQVLTLLVFAICAYKNYEYQRRVFIFL